MVIVVKDCSNVEIDVVESVSDSATVVREAHDEDAVHDFAVRASCRIDRVQIDPKNGHEMHVGSIGISDHDQNGK